MKYFKLLLLLGVLVLLNGCFLTKVVTVPMRLGAAVVSVVPIVGNSAHDAIDEAAEVVDEVPIQNLFKMSNQVQIFVAHPNHLNSTKTKAI